MFQSQPSNLTLLTGQKTKINHEFHELISAVVDYGQIGSNRTIIFRAPGHQAPGAYKLEVRRRFGQTRPATGTLENMLVVV